MYQVRYILTSQVYDLIGFNGDKIIIRFNNGQSVGTVPTTGYLLLEKEMDWKQVKEHFEMQKELDKEVTNA